MSGGYTLTPHAARTEYVRSRAAVAGVDAALREWDDMLAAVRAEARRVAAFELVGEFRRVRTETPIPQYQDACSFAIGAIEQHVRNQEATQREGGDGYGTGEVPVV